MQENFIKAKWHSFFALLQRLGQALMVPVSVLPAAGLMVAFGRLFTDFTKNDHSLFFHFGKVMYSCGLVIFEQLALIFAVGVAIGFTGAAGISGLAAVTGYFVFTTLLKSFSEMLNLPSPINCGVLGGIAVGLMVASLYNRFHQLKLNPIFGFFSGKRLIPILSVVGAVLMGLVFVVVWPPIQNGIHSFGEGVMGSYFGPSLYASIKRLLIPVGLHHVFYPSFLYEFGSYTTAAGQVVKGEATRYFAGDPSAGRFMASEFPMMIFGLPAAAFAMAMRAKPENRKAVAGVMLTAALTSMITGITEPIEFAFTFVAPPLYFIHAALAFLSGVITNALDIHLGYTFSASLIDLALGFFNQKNISLLFLVVGPVMAALYFGIFYWAIGFFNFKTPGREDERNDASDESVGVGGTSRAQSSSKDLVAKATAVLKAVGGKNNIVSLDACITRLRLKLKNDSALDQATLKRWGASGVMIAGGGNVQIVFGVESDFLKGEIQKLIAQSVDSAERVGSPLSGKFLNKSEIPDETFAQGLMGNTVGILPSGNRVVAPFDGKVATLFRTFHAIGLESREGIEVLIHVGIDTVQLNGEGFKAFVKEGDQVKKGQVLLEFNRSLIEQKAKSLITPVVITNADQFSDIKVVPQFGQNLDEGDGLWK